MRRASTCRSRCRVGVARPAGEVRLLLHDRARSRAGELRLPTVQLLCAVREADLGLDEGALRAHEETAAAPA